MTEAGLEEINTNDRVYSDADSLFSGYSDCTLRITYQATMDSDNSLVSGDIGNLNEVVLTWKRSNTSYYDTLVDDAHVRTYRGLCQICDSAENPCWQYDYRI